MKDSLKRHFDNDGRIVMWSTKRAIREELFAYLASHFVPQRKYNESEVNVLLRRLVQVQDMDEATLRRDLCDFRYLQRTRNGAQYWLRESSEGATPASGGGMLPTFAGGSSQMEDNEPQSPTTIIAEQILSQKFGGKVRLDAGQDLGGSQRNLVLRSKVLEGPPSAPESVIIKQANGFLLHSPNQANWEIFNDFASLQFLPLLTDGGTPLAPAFYSGDQTAGLYVMEDLGTGTRLDHLLMSQDTARAEEGLLAYATLHGHLHALSMGREEEHMHIRSALGSTEPPNNFYGFTWLGSILQAMAEQLSLSVIPGTLAELDEISEMLANPGPFQAFIQSDAAPDNIQRVGESWRMLDFEGGRYTHALLEGAYLRMPFPTCWCVYRLPDALTHKAEAAYRAELAKGCPTATDDALYGRAMAGACIYWALAFHYLLRPLELILAKDRHLVALTDRQRSLLYVRNATRTCEEYGCFPATGEMLQTIAVRLGDLWPEAVDAPLYPAFDSR